MFNILLGHISLHVGYVVNILNDSVYLVESTDRVYIISMSVMSQGCI